MKKLFTLLTLALLSIGTAWADDYTPTADEVIILNNAYNSEATTTGYSNHKAVTWDEAGTSITTSAKAGDPNNGGAATSENVTCYSIKNNGGKKNIKLHVSGVSKITLYQIKHESRYPQLILTPNSGDGSTLSGNTNVYFNEFEIDGTKSYTIELQGYDGSTKQDGPQVYAVKLTKYVVKTIDTQSLTGVKVGGSALTENAAENGYSISGTTVTLTDVAYAKPTTVTLTNHVTYTDTSSEDKNVSVTFSETPSEGYWTGTATIGETTYTVKVPYAAQSVTGISINGTDISASDLATLNSTKAVTIDGSSLNGIGMINVSLTGGTTAVSRANSENNAVYTFTLNGDDNYTVTVSNVKKTYTAEGTVFGATASLNANTHTSNGITFTQVNTGKSFQYGTGRVTISGNEYIPVKLSTGSKVNVTFPAGYVATKVKIYGWSANGDGKLNFIKETDDASAKTVGDISGDIFYATNTSSDLYPSVYEYDLDNWSSMCFNPGGSPSQPFVVMDFTLSNSVTATVGTYGWATFVTPAALDFTSVSGVKAYIVTGHSGNTVATTQMTGTVPANTPLLLEGVTTAIPVAASSTTDVSANLLKAGAAIGTEAGKTKYVLADEGGKATFLKIVSDITVPSTKAYLEFNEEILAPTMSLEIGNLTGIQNITTAANQGEGMVFDLQGRKVAQPVKGLYIVNGKKVVIK